MEEKKIIYIGIASFLILITLFLLIQMRSPTGEVIEEEIDENIENTLSDAVVSSYVLESGSAIFFLSNTGTQVRQTTPSLLWDGKRSFDGMFWWCGDSDGKLSINLDRQYTSISDITYYELVRADARGRPSSLSFYVDCDGKETKIGERTAVPGSSFCTSEGGTIDKIILTDLKPGCSFNKLIVKWTGSTGATCGQCPGDKKFAIIPEIMMTLSA